MTLHHAGEIAARALQTEQRAMPEKATSAMPTETAEAPRISAVRKLWVRMAAIYGYRWTSAYGERCDDDDGVLTIPGDTWQRGLSGVSEHRIGTGLNACLMSADPWPPTLPHFRALCMEIPSLALVIKIIRNGENFTPFVSLVWHQLDANRFRQASIDKSDLLLRDAYGIAREHAMSGAAMPVQRAAIAHTEPAKTYPSSRPSDPDIAKRELNKMAVMLGNPKPFPELDA
jgi:hypothetical protein